MTAAGFSAVFAGLSAVTAIYSAVAARRSRSARNAAIAAQNQIAGYVGQIAAVQQSQQTSDESRQARAVSFESEIQRNRQGWVVTNPSDGPLSQLIVQTTTGSTLTRPALASLVTYRSGQRPIGLPPRSA